MALAEPMRAPDPILERLSALHPQKIDLSLNRMERLMAALDHPERRLPPTIHVAGTNGKGSTIAFMRAMLEAAGKSVHVYTSPHLVRFNERVRLGGVGGDGRLEGDAALYGALGRVGRGRRRHRWGLRRGDRRAANLRLRPHQRGRRP